VNIREAKSIAFGSKPPKTLQAYYDAWQWLYDNHVALSEPDENYMDKLVCDGHITIDK
tara:strand:- start:178 stop:351 length:174 start_codon:yes stop_codon:yes gene_type:complete